ncbi:hypothetical protein [Thalassotalea eurytherma]|nr:hypothetical protein [Thalassotalea eurytherma]
MTFKTKALVGMTVNTEDMSHCGEGRNLQQSAVTKPMKRNDLITKQ